MPESDEPRPGGMQLGLFLFVVEPLALLFAILVISAALKALAFAGDQLLTIPAALVLPFAIPVWALKRHRALHPAAKAGLLVLLGACWCGITYVALELEVLTAGIHQPGGALLLFFPTLGFAVGAAILGGVAIHGAMKP